MTQPKFEELKQNCKPHEVFNLEWSTYNTIDFADTFLPSVRLVKGKGLWIYDGAKLFEGIEKTTSVSYQLTSDKELISLLCYTYPKGVLAEKNKHKVEPSRHELCMFVEIDKEENIEIHYKFGRNALLAFEKIKGSYFKAKAMQENPIKTNIQEFEKHFYQTEFLNDSI